MTARTAQFARVLEATERDARLRWWCGQLDSFGRNLDEHKAQIDGSIDRVDAALSDYRRLL